MLFPGAAHVVSITPYNFPEAASQGDAVEAKEVVLCVQKKNLPI